MAPPSPGLAAPADAASDSPLACDRVRQDPLGLGSTEASLSRFQESEVIHGRWAMLGVAGALAVEILGLGNWFDAPLWVSAPVLCSIRASHNAQCISSAIFVSPCETSTS